MPKTLQLQFETAKGKKLVVSIDNPKASLSDTEVQTGMEELIASNVFHVEGIPISIVSSAKVVERNVTQII